MTDDPPSLRLDFIHFCDHALVHGEGMVRAVHPIMVVAIGLRGTDTIALHVLRIRKAQPAAIR